MYYDVIMAGFGGQGIQIISQLVAEACINRGLELSYLPSYGVEKRGGRTNVTLVVSDGEIGSPITNHPVAVIAMDRIALEKYMPMIAPQGLLVANTSLIPEEIITRNDITALKIPCNDEALKLGGTRVSNMIALGAFLERTKIVGFDDIEKAMGSVIPERLKHTIPGNLAALRRGMELAAEASVS